MSHSAPTADALRRALPADPLAGRGATVRVAEVTVAVRTEAAAVAEWLSHYMSAFWHVDGSTGPASARLADAEVTAVADRSARLRLRALAYQDGPHRDPRQDVHLYLGATGRRLAVGPYLMVAGDTEPLAIVRQGPRINVVADDGEVLGLAVVRVVRALAGALLEKRGFALVHAAAAAMTGAETAGGPGGLLALGTKGAGKTTATVSLATRRGWAVAAHDRCYVGLLEGRPCALPWPSSLNIGLGLADALGWTSQLRARYLDGERPPYHQDQTVTAAVLAGHNAPVRAGGRELKIQLLPSQVTGWFGIELARSLVPLALVFPEVDLEATRARVLSLAWPPVTVHDVFPPVASADHYPDFLGLNPVTATRRAQRALTILRGLSGVIPAYRVRLCRNMTDNAAVLAALLTSPKFR